MEFGRFSFACSSSLFACSLVLLCSSESMAWAQPAEIIYFKLTRARSQSSSRRSRRQLRCWEATSRGYYLEMICADSLAGANLDNGDPEMLLFSMTRFFKFLPGEQRQAFLESLSENAA